MCEFPICPWSIAPIFTPKLSELCYLEKCVGRRVERKFQSSENIPDLLNCPIPVNFKFIMYSSM
jgi:hypothetical protein